MVIEDEFFIEELQTSKCELVKNVGCVCEGEEHCRCSHGKSRLQWRNAKTMTEPPPPTPVSVSVIFTTTSSHLYSLSACETSSERKIYSLFASFIRSCDDSGQIKIKPISNRHMQRPFCLYGGHSFVIKTTDMYDSRVQFHRMVC